MATCPTCFREGYHPNEIPQILFGFRNWELHNGIWQPPPVTETLWSETRYVYSDPEVSHSWWGLGYEMHRSNIPSIEVEFTNLGEVRYLEHQIPNNITGSKP